MTGTQLYTQEWLVHETPSRKDGVSYEQELEFILHCCQLIADVAPELHVYAFSPCAAPATVPCSIIMQKNGRRFAFVLPDFPFLWLLDSGTHMASPFPPMGMLVGMSAPLSAAVGMFEIVVLYARLMGSEA